MEIKETIKEAKEQIERAIEQNGGFSHNIVSLTLAGVAKNHGVEAANELVEEYSLTELYGIYPLTVATAEESKNDQPLPTPEPKPIKIELITREQKRAKREAENDKKLEELYHAIVKLNTDPTLKIEFEPSKSLWRNGSNYNIEFTTTKREGIYASVVLNPKRTFSYLALPSTYYVWIDTNDYSTNHHRNWTFEKTKNLPQKVYNKAKEFIDGLITQADRYDETIRIEKETEEYLKRTYDVKSLREVKFNSGESYANSSSVTLRLPDQGSLGARITDLEKKTYRITSLSYSVTEKQFKRILEILKDTDK